MKVGGRHQVVEQVPELSRARRFSPSPGNLNSNLPCLGPSQEYPNDAIISNPLPVTFANEHSWVFVCLF